MEIYNGYVNTSNALMLRMTREQIRFQMPLKLLGVNSWMP